MKRVDERDTMSARAQYKKGSEDYADYYSRNPEKKAIDDSIRQRPNLCSEGTNTYNPLNSPMASCAFEFLEDIRHLSEGKVNPEKVQGNKNIITKRIKGLARKYGAKLVGITELKDYHFYTHRGRLEDFCSLCKNCAFTCPSESISNEPEKESNGHLNWIIEQETCYIRWRQYGTDCGICISSCPFSQQMESIKAVDTFKDNEAVIATVLGEFRKKYGTRPFVPGNPDWLR
ncbi:4Fe-4S dicluster domain-containing protein [Clostridium magnum]|uniref:3-chloro-4-hydroxyphenylacetate reductive dehalogenase n=1 Tax=Clostridium magnum DSM 2767 TaxID=1121326 RepID=A0A162T6H0_9CLOT|nr:4Fe-4S dicluster domain-containing protein [Clostridium magnum]KZL92294.1 3-chloro-4-hydroxyphenylacetate reductive dehalogenase precursor [Clostridium magnum DSM 2767]SHH14479.1 hypothetical protein SAMN02745944_00124 [Clostridium magnum DSM 2767]